MGLRQIHTASDFARRRGQCQGNGLEPPPLDTFYPASRQLTRWYDKNGRLAIDQISATLVPLVLGGLSNADTLTLDGSGDGTVKGNRAITGRIDGWDSVSRAD